MIPTAEQILTNLPNAIVFWTAITLSWGVYMCWLYSRSVNVKLWAGETEYVWNVYCMVLANAVLITLLILESLLAYFMDAVIVINVFYGAYLTYISWFMITSAVDAPDTKD